MCCIDSMTKKHLVWAQLPFQFMTKLFFSDILQKWFNIYVLASIWQWRTCGFLCYFQHLKHKRSFVVINILKISNCKKHSKDFWL